MSYQPPLFGWKQLLNFTAGSFPDIGGWLIIAPAVVVVTLLFYEMVRKYEISVQKNISSKSKQLLSAAAVFCVLFLAACLASCNTEPQPIVYGKDQCEMCKMTIMDKRFGAELINKNGKTLKFDSDECMLSYSKVNTSFNTIKTLVANYCSPEELIETHKAFFLHGGNINSPMGGQLAAFKTKDEAEKFQKELQGEILLWNDVTQLEF